MLADPRAQSPDLVLVGGDAVPGPFAQATLDRLAPLDARWIRQRRARGRRGRRRAGPRPGRPGRRDRQDHRGRASAREASKALGELPLTLELDGVLYCHATPRADDEMVTRISTPERWAEVLSTTTAPLVVAGHTHQQDDRVVGETRFVNAGSVGLPYEGDGAARWLWVADGVPELRRTTYDHRAAGERMRERWPDVRSIGGRADRPGRPARGDPDLREPYRLKRSSTDVTTGSPQSRQVRSIRGSGATGSSRLARTRGSGRRSPRSRRPAGTRSHQPSRSKASGWPARPPRRSGSAGPGRNGRLRRSPRSGSRGAGCGCRAGPAPRRARRARRRRPCRRGTPPRRR